MTCGFVKPTASYGWPAPIPAHGPSCAAWAADSSGVDVSGGSSIGRTWSSCAETRARPIAGRDYHRQITRLQPPEIARLLDDLPYLHAAELLTLIPDPLAADTLEVMTTDRQTQVIQVLDADQAVRLITLMASDAAADLLGKLKPHSAERLLLKIPDEQRRLIVELLRYPADTAGGIMTNQLVCVPLSMSVADARRDLKQQMATTDFVHYLYVVDDMATRHLEGVVVLRDFALAGDEQLVASLMNRRLNTDRCAGAGRRSSAPGG